MKKCSHCLYVYPENAGFCPECGAIDQEVAPPVTPPVSKVLWTQEERQLVGHLPMKLQEVLALRQKRLPFIKCYWADHSVTPEVLRSHNIMRLSSDEVPLMYIAHNTDRPQLYLGLGMIITNKGIIYPGQGLGGSRRAFYNNLAKITCDDTRLGHVITYHKKDQSSDSHTMKYAENYIISLRDLLDIFLTEYR